MQKRRITITADPQHLAAGRRAVDDDEYGSLSEWANAAMAEKASRDIRVRLLHQLLAEYEETNGPISEAEMRAQERIDREAAIVVRTSRQPAA
jgi:hypothetical protein